jgi:ADP-ribosylglycohydrolase
MYGAIIGDICGSIFEFSNFKTDKPEEIPIPHPKCFFTDDTVLTCAVIDTLLTDKDYKRTVCAWANKYPDSGYGGRFYSWFESRNPKPYNSWGNGSAMRVSAVGWAFSTIEETLAEAKRSAEITHNHPEGIKGAQATAAAIFLARQKKSKDEIRKYIAETFFYDLNRTLKDIRPEYRFDESCQGTVPQAIIAFLESKNYTTAIQNAISLGGDSDTIACITSGIAEAFYRDIPNELIEFAKKRLTREMVEVVGRFYKRFVVG